MLAFDTLSGREHVRAAALTGTGKGLSAGPPLASRAFAAPLVANGHHQAAQGLLQMLLTVAGLKSEQVSQDVVDLIPGGHSAPFGRFAGLLRLAHVFGQGDDGFRIDQVEAGSRGG